MVTYSGNFSVNKRTAVPEQVTDGYVWADHFNRAHQAGYGQYPTAVNTAFPSSQEYLKELKNRSENPGLSKVEINHRTGNPFFMPAYIFPGMVKQHDSPGLYRYVWYLQHTKVPEILPTA